MDSYSTNFAHISDRTPYPSVACTYLDRCIEQGSLNRRFLLDSILSPNRMYSWI